MPVKSAVISTIVVERAAIASNWRRTSRHGKRARAPRAHAVAAARSAKSPAARRRGEHAVAEAGPARPAASRVASLTAPGPRRRPRHLEALPPRVEGRLGGVGSPAATSMRS